MSGRPIEQTSEVISWPNAASGITSLDPGDVLALLRIAFWRMGGPCNHEFAVRQVAIVAFMAMAHLGIKPLARLMLRPSRRTEPVYDNEWWFEEDESGYFTVRDGYALRTHRAPEELTYAVRRYCAIRPENSCDHLFVTSHGLPLEASSYSLTAKCAADGLELGRPLPTMLKEFCADRIRRYPNEEAIAYCFARKYDGRRPIVDPEVADGALTHFEGKLRRAMEDDAFAIELLRSEFRTRMPSVARTFPTTSGSAWTRRLGPEKHPWIGELLAKERPRQRHAMRVFREALFVEYYPKMRLLLESGELAQVQARQLLGYSSAGWRTRLLKETYGENWWAETEPAYPGSWRALTMREASK
jgi:hypothetical protein